MRAAGPWLPALTMVLVLAFAAALAALFWLAVPEPNKDMVNFMLGQLSVFTAGALGFWFGTSKSSADKTDALASIAAQGAASGPVEGDGDVSGAGLPEPAFGAARGVSGQNSSEGV